MSVNENGSLRPDGLSLSWTPSLPRVGMVGLKGTWYWNPGPSGSPAVTFAGMYGKGRDVWKFGPPLASFGGGLVFRRNGMSSSDTLGWGTNSNVSTVLPSVSVNTSIPSKGEIPQFSKNKVSSIEAGVSNSVGASRTTTYTVTPQQIAEFLAKYSPPATVSRPWASPLIRDSAAAAGVPSRNNVWEYDYPNSSQATSGHNGGDNAEGTHIPPREEPAFASHAAPVPYLAQGRQPIGGIPAMIAMATGAGQPEATEARAPAGGLLGMIQDYMNGYPSLNNSR